VADYLILVSRGRVQVAGEGRGYECVVKSPSRGLVEGFIPGGDIGKHEVAASECSAGCAALMVQWRVFRWYQR
jgi:hypothetical protein